jgi:hypothetical protein
MAIKARTAQGYLRKELIKIGSFPSRPEIKPVGITVFMPMNNQTLSSRSKKMFLLANVSTYVVKHISSKPRFIRQ